MCKDRKPKDGVLRLPDVTGGDMRRSKQKSVGRSSQKGRKKARREGGRGGERWGGEREAKLSKKDPLPQMLLN